MLELRNICKTYKPKNGPEVKALKSVSVKFPEKGLVFFLGKSGCGKSTLLNCIGGLDKFDSGEIIIKGKSSKEFSGSDFDSYRNTFIGFIFQEYNILSEFNIEKNIALALELQGKKADKKAVDKILEMVDLKEFGKRKTTELSGGQKQRVAIARALIKEPEIIVADEPTGALDSATGIQVFDTLKKLAQNKLVIVVSHDREFAEIYGDRIIEMKDGVIISDETKRKVAPNAVSDDLTIIGDDLIHIKKGHKFSQEEKDMIIKFLESRDTETIISVDDKKNQKFKQVAKIDDSNHTEKFTETTDEDRKSKEYNKKDLKLIKSRLKWKDSFKMGASSLKAKPVRLMFTILLSFIAFAIFGVVDALGTFNRPLAVYETITEFDNKYVSLLKETPGQWGNDTAPWTETDIKTINEMFPDIKVVKVANSGVNFGSHFYSNYYNNALMFSSFSGDTNNVAKKPFMSGMVYIAEADLAGFGLTKVAGRMPEANNEIAISKHIFDCVGWLDANKTVAYEDLLNVNKNKVNIRGTEYKVVGIIDDGVDLTEYTNLTAEEIDKKDLEEQIARQLSFGFTNIVYVNETYYNEMLQQKISYNGMQIYKAGETEDSIGYFYGDFYTQDKIVAGLASGNIDQFASQFNYYSSTHHNSVVGNKNSTIDLEDGTIILSRSMRDSLSIDDYQMSQGTAKITLKDQNDQVVGEYTVVGFCQDLYSMLQDTCFVSESDLATINGAGSGLKIFYEGTERSIASQNYTTLENAYKDANMPWQQNNGNGTPSNALLHLKPGVTTDADGAPILANNQIVIGAEYLTNFAAGEELYNAIDAGLTIDIKIGATKLTFEVVGITGGGAYVSNETFTNTIEPLYKGFDYGIALLSGSESVDKAFIQYCETLNDSNTKFTVQNGATPILDQFGEIISDVASIVFWVGVGFAVFAALMLMNFISTSISYKKREIGILRALGARSSDVFGIFFNESMVIAIINFILATVATFVASGIITSSIINKLGLELVLLSTGIRQIVLILAVSVGSAFLASLLPVYKIAKKQPIDAINNR